MKRIVPPAKEWIVKFRDGLEYIYDPWEGQYYFIHPDRGLWGCEKGEFDVLLGKSVSGNYYKELRRIVEDIVENPEKANNLPNKPTLVIPPSKKKRGKRKRARSTKKFDKMVKEKYESK